MIKIIAIGKIKEEYLSNAIKDYQKRISNYDKIEIIELKDEKIIDNASDKEIEKIKEIEGNRILEKIDKDDYVISLDLKGKMLDSISLSKKIEEIRTYHTSNITFIIGGSLGLSQQVRDKSNYLWKLSDLTFPHQLCRVILLEQIYRSFKILRNETYHK